MSLIYVLITELEVGVIRADMVASTEYTFHHQCNAHSIEETKVFGNPILLKKGERLLIERQPQMVASGGSTHNLSSHHQARHPSPMQVYLKSWPFPVLAFGLSHFLLTIAKMSLASRALRWRRSRRNTISRNRKPRSTWPMLLRILLKAL